MDLRSKQQHEFIGRHIGPNEAETTQMLQAIGMNSINELIDKTVPASIRLPKALDVSSPISEFDYLLKISTMGKKNQLKKDCNRYGLLWHHHPECDTSKCI
jgi:glycine dehydrogenase